MLLEIRRVQCVNIDSLSIYDYLSGHPYLLVPNQRFSRYLSLDPFTYFLNEMYNSEGLGYRLNEAQRTNMLAQLGNRQAGSTGDVFEGLKSGVEDDFRRLVFSQGVAENARAFYLDPDGGIKVSGIIQGDHTSVDSQVPQLVEDGKIPLLEAHSHPRDSLPSAQDYWPLLTTWDDDPTLPSICRGVMVLCPSIQVLALSTFQTPRLKFNDAKNLWQSYDENTPDGDKNRLDFLERRVVSIVRARKRVWDMLTTSMQRMVEIEERMQSEGRTRDEILRVGETERQQTIQQIDLFSGKIDRIQNRAIEKYMNLLYKITTRKSMEFARLINVALYGSVNCRDFYQFSA